MHVWYQVAWSGNCSKSKPPSPHTQPTSNTALMQLFLILSNTIAGLQGTEAVHSASQYLLQTHKTSKIFFSKAKKDAGVSVCFIATEPYFEWTLKQNWAYMVSNKLPDTIILWEKKYFCCYIVPVLPLIYFACNQQSDPGAWEEVFKFFWKQLIVSSKTPTEEETWSSSLVPFIFK